MQLQLTWYKSVADSGYFSLGTITKVLPLTIAGANKDTKLNNGYSSGQAIPITPTASLIRTVQPYNVVSCKDAMGNSKSA